MVTPPPPTLTVRDLRKAYGARPALDGLSFDLHPGEVLGLLGPNGAGKTTTIESIAGLVTPDAGTIQLQGAPLDRQARARIGLALQDTRLQDSITPREAIVLFARFYRVRPDRDALLARFGLTEQANTRYVRLSGGQRQRLALALAFLNDPPLILLDEPTAGLDPVARHELHDLIRTLAQDGRAILLATHDMAEAERLCDRLIVTDRGRIVAEGTPAALIGNDGKTLIEGRTDIALDPARMPHDLTLDGQDFSLHTTDPNRALADLAAAIDAQGVSIVSLRLGQPALEDIILALTRGAVPPSNNPASESRPSC